VNLSGLVAIALAWTSAGAVGQASLPDTPQGRRVAAYVRAFNAGEAAFVAAYDELFTPGFAKLTTAEARSARFKSLSRDFGPLDVSRLLSAGSQKIVVVAMTRAGKAATFSFSFETGPPYRIAGLDLSR
jgi:hypothetical protein